MNAPVFYCAHYIIIIKLAKCIKMLFDRIDDPELLQKEIQSICGSDSWYIFFHQFLCSLNNFYQHYFCAQNCFVQIHLPVH